MSEQGTASVDSARVVRVGVPFVLVSTAIVFGWQFLGQLPTFAATSSACGATEDGIQIHYQVGESTGDLGISGIELSGFEPASCDGKPVKVTFSGNDAGDPAAEAVRLLAVLDSSQDPCAGSPAEHPDFIGGGRIELRACSTVTDYTGAAYADLHDVTRLRVQVDDREMPLSPGVDGDTSAPDAEILGVEQRAAGSSPGASAGLGPQTAGFMPATGGPQSLMLWSGVLLVMFGLASLAWDLTRPRGQVDL